jgi:Domain of unknown function (DUF4190)
MKRRRDDDSDEIDIRRREPDIGENAAIRMLIPVGRSGWAIGAGYLALLSVLCLPAPFARFAGIMAVREIRRDPTKHGMGRAIFGIVMGGLGTALLLVWLVAVIVSGLNGGFR